MKTTIVTLTSEQRQTLQQELAELQQRLKGEFTSPKDFRRKDEIISLLMTDGESSTVKFNFVKGRESKRVTSFTKDRR